MTRGTLKSVKSNIIYNNTWHSELKTTQSNFLFSNSFPVNDPIHIHSDTLENWKAAHPKYTPFSI